jgi:hypothetical protein
MSGMGPSGSGVSTEPGGSVEGTVFIVKFDEMYFSINVDPKTFSRNQSPLITWDSMEARGSLYTIYTISFLWLVCMPYIKYKYARKSSSVHMCLCGNGCVRICTIIFSWFMSVECMSE